MIASGVVSSLPPLESLMARASEVSGLDKATILQRCRRREIVNCRAAIAAAAAREGFGHGAIAALLGLDRTTVIHLLGLVERPAVRQLLVGIGRVGAVAIAFDRAQPGIELDCAHGFDGDAVEMIIMDYTLGHFKEALCTSSHENDTTAPSGIIPVEQAGPKTSPRPNASPAARKPQIATAIKKTIRSSRSTTPANGERRKEHYRPISRSSSRFMTGDELREYATGELGMSEEEFREARYATRVFPTNPRRHAAGAG